MCFAVSAHAPAGMPIATRSRVFMSSSLRCRSRPHHIVHVPGNLALHVGLVGNRSGRGLYR
jgi:hypothetical protein